MWGLCIAERPALHRCRVGGNQKPGLFWGLADRDFVVFWVGDRPRLPGGGAQKTRFFFWDHVAICIQLVSVKSGETS